VLVCALAKVLSWSVLSWSASSPALAKVLAWSRLGPAWLMCGVGWSSWAARLQYQSSWTVLAATALVRG
jgi:hypothetical protein